MKKLISLIIAIALVVCLLPVMASAEVVTGIGLEATASGYVGDYVWLQPEYIGGDEWPADLVWTSSDPTIVEVSGSNWSCDCNLLAPGTATVTVTAGTLSASCEITAVAPDVLTLDTPLKVTAAGYASHTATFTAAEAGTYTIYVPTSDGQIAGYVDYSMGYADFASDSTGTLMTAAVELAAGETCTVHSNAYQEEATNYELLVIKTPARTGLTLSKESIELKHMSGNPDYDQIEILPEPITAAISGDFTWKILNENVAIIGYAWGNYCAVESVAVGSTVLEVYDAEQTLIASIPVVVKDAMEDAQEIVWGVEYDMDAEDTVFTFTPAVTDTYTFQSTGDASGDPYMSIVEMDQTSFNTLFYFDDYDNSYNFYGEAALTAGKEYVILISNYRNQASFTFSMKGTAASDPGYDLKKVAAKPASCAAEGNIEYYECQKTGILFANAEATKLAGDVTIAKVAHKLDKVAAVAATSEKEGNVAHEKCSVCGALFVEGKEVKAADVAIAKLDNASTGDTTMLVPVMALLVLSALGLGITAVARKKA